MCAQEQNNRWSQRLPSLIVFDVRRTCENAFYIRIHDMMPVQAEKSRASVQEQLAWASLIGDVENLERLVHQTPRVFQVNIIGTGHDTRAERAVLDADVWPYLRQVCKNMVRNISHDCSTYFKRQVVS